MEDGRKQWQNVLFVMVAMICTLVLNVVEVVKYLYENDYTIYVVSGTERTITRAIVDNSPRMQLFI
jgi:hypothetical protein